MRAAQLDRVGVGDVVAVEEDASRRRLDEPVDHLHRRRLAAPRRTDEDADLAVGDVERQLVDGDATVGYVLPTASRRIIGTAASASDRTKLPVTLPCDRPRARGASGPGSTGRGSTDHRRRDPRPSPRARRAHASSRSCSGVLIALPLVVVITRWRTRVLPSTLAIDRASSTRSRRSRCSRCCCPCTGSQRTTALIAARRATRCSSWCGTRSPASTASHADVKEAGDGHGLLAGAGAAARRAAAGAARDHRRRPHRHGDARSGSSPSPRSSARAASGTSSSTASTATSGRRSSSASCCPLSLAVVADLLLLGVLTPGDAMAKEKVAR